MSAETISKTKWTMPAWMNEYRKFMGGWPDRDLIARAVNYAIEKGATNAINEQVNLLTGLHKAGKLE